MSLQVWLPLINDLRNNGVSDLIPKQVTEPVFVDGKLGKAMSTGSFDLPSNYVAKFYNNTAMSFTFWIYPVGSSGSGPILGREAMAAGNNRMYTIFQYPSPNDLHLSWQSNESSTTFLENILYGAFPANTWTHCAIVYDGAKADIYLNGIYRVSWYGVSTRTNFEYNVPLISKSIRYLNDLRIYNHVLSPKEVKEISKGLVAHYQLNDPYSTGNLIPNGFGQDGALGWANNNYSTADIPPNQPAIKASYYSGNMTTSYIPISHSTDYTINMYIKATSSATGTTYPSIYPYDADKKFIDYYKCTIGFGAAYKTTLAQPLHKGDTVIYATNLSAWTTATDNHYFHVAIFGYADSTGYVYPDMGYTADSPSFGSKTDKSNINKTNNTITLLAPFTGEDRPAGTTICQATEGATYFYPYGGISVSTIADWTYKTAVIDVNNTRLRFAKYVNFMSYWGAYYAGIQLLDNKANQIVYDSSGYNYHGKPIDNPTTGVDSARYSLSTNFDGVSSGVIIENLPLSPIINSEITYSFWIKPDSKNGARSIYFGSYSANSWSIEKTTSNVLRLYWMGNPDEYCSGATISDGVWQHICITKKGTSDVKVYINGELKWTSTASHNTLSFPTTYRIGRDYRSGDNTPYKGKMSDFRIYATALSAEDIKELYQISASIDNDGNIYAYELNEV